MTSRQIIGRGAEAIIYLENNTVTKDRISKSYRHPDLDKKIIKRRTKAETKILKLAGEIILTPNVYDTKEKNKINMEMIEGDKLAETLDNYQLKKQKEVLSKIGTSVAKLHEAGIIHGDLTTSNMILKKNEVYFIDFGLGFLNGKYEDKGVDVHLLKQALEAKHFKNWEILFSEFEKSYREVEPIESEKVFIRLVKIEKRGRYKH